VPRLASEWIKAGRNRRIASTANEGKHIVRSVLYLTPKHGDSAKVVDYYRRAGVLERALGQDGCLGAALHVPRDGSGRVLVTALWRNAEAYDGWVANPTRGQDAEELAGLVEEDMRAGVRGVLYDVAILVGTDEA
jgi:quinol monooxygenase YgiN